jgi:hypothetical protein
VAFEVYDDFEALVLDFLAFRRNRGTAVPVSVSAANHPVIRKDIPQPAKPLLPGNGNSIGKGWPHYKTAAATEVKKTVSKVFVDEPNQAVNPPSLEPIEGYTEKNEIIRYLEPIVQSMVEHFGHPKTNSDLSHLKHQVLAEAMSMPLVGESLHAGEMRPWGRVPLLQAVVELMLLRY